MLDDIELSEDRARKIADALNQIEREAKAAHRQEVSQFKAELGKLEGREDELYDAYTEGVLDKAGYKRQLERLRQEKRRYADLAGEAHFDITDATLVTAKKLIELARD